MVLSERNMDELVNKDKSMALSRRNVDKIKIQLGF